MNEIWDTTREGEELGKRFEGIDRAAFARKHGLSSQSMIYQHITGRRPISLAAAVEYASAFRCTLREISPRISAEVAKAAPFLHQGAVDEMKTARAAQCSQAAREVIDAILAVDRAGVDKEILKSVARIVHCLLEPPGNERI